MAEWQSGYAAACKAVDAGSIPTSAYLWHNTKVKDRDQARGGKQGNDIDHGRDHGKKQGKNNGHIESITPLIKQVAELLKSNNLHLISVESCTGGGVGYYCTSLSGASDWYECGYITYHNSDKERLGVPQDILDKYGAVSEQCVIGMAEAALNRVESHSDKNYCSLAISGIAGPEGGSKEKPVGSVCFAWAARHLEFSYASKLFKGNREEIRQQSIVYALEGLIQFLTTEYE